MDIQVGKQYRIDIASYAPFYESETRQTTYFNNGHVVSVEDLDQWDDWGDVALVGTGSLVTWLPVRFLIPVEASQ